MEDKPSWIEGFIPEEFKKDDLFSIIEFFVIHSPCIGSSTNPKPPSVIGKPVTEYGWSKRWQNYRNPNSLNYILRNASTNFALIYSATGSNDMKQACEKAGLLNDFPAKTEKECAAFSLTDQNQFLSLFRHIRNAFAHCRINMLPIDNKTDNNIDNKDMMLFFEDIGQKRNEGIPVSARIMLRKSTLLEWIHIIEGGPQNNPDQPIT